MKNLILSMVLVLSISVFAQNKPTTTTTTTTKKTETTTTETKPATTTQSKSTTTKTKKQTKPKSKKSKSTAKTKKPKSGDQVVDKALYSEKEKEKARKNFYKEIDSIGMSPEVKKEYTAIVKKHWARIQGARKGSKLTKDAATEYVNQVIRDQNSEIQRILNVDQFKKHEVIMDKYQNSVLYRIEQY